jgi:hypothetical protein
MRNVFLTAMVALLLLSVSAFCEEKAKNHSSFSFGFSAGQRAGDVTESIILTSPYKKTRIFPNRQTNYAIRLSGDLRYKNGIPDGKSMESLMVYYAARFGLVGTADIAKLLRLYEEFGCVSVFPTAELSSATKPRIGLYGYFGSEFLLGKNLLTRGTSTFMEIGLEGLYSEHRFDKLANRPLMGWGPTASAGVRFYL